MRKKTVTIPEWMRSVFTRKLHFSWTWRVHSANLLERGTWCTCMSSTRKPDTCWSWAPAGVLAPVLGAYHPACERWIWGLVEGGDVGDLGGLAPLSSGPAGEAAPPKGQLERSLLSTYWTWALFRVHSKHCFISSWEQVCKSSASLHRDAKQVWQE